MWYNSRGAVNIFSAHLEMVQILEKGRTSQNNKVFNLMILIGSHFLQNSNNNSVHKEKHFKEVRFNLDS